MNIDSMIQGNPRRLLLHITAFWWRTAWKWRTGSERLISLNIKEKEKENEKKSGKVIKKSQDYYA